MCQPVFGLKRAAKVGVPASADRFGARRFFHAAVRSSTACWARRRMAGVSSDACRAGCGGANLTSGSTSRSSHTRRGPPYTNPIASQIALMSLSGSGGSPSLPLVRIDRSDGALVATGVRPRCRPRRRLVALDDGGRHGLVAGAALKGENVVGRRRRGGAGRRVVRRLPRGGPRRGALGGVHGGHCPGRAVRPQRLAVTVARTGIEV
jgi:hypothetical protein